MKCREIACVHSWSFLENSLDSLNKFHSYSTFCASYKRIFIKRIYIQIYPATATQTCNAKVITHTKNPIQILLNLALPRLKIQITFNNIRSWTLLSNVAEQKAAHFKVTQTTYDLFIQRAPSQSNRFYPMQIYFITPNKWE